MVRKAPRRLLLPLLAGIAVLPLPATDPPPVAQDGSGIAWNLRVADDGVRSLRVGCKPGRRYTVEQSADLAQWSPVRSWTGLAASQVVETDVFAGPPPADAGPAGTPPPPSGDHPRTAVVFVQPVDDGGTVLGWWTGGASARVREPASSGSWGPPTMVMLHAMEMEGWSVMLQSTDLRWKASSPSLPPSDPQMSAEDAAFHALLLSHRAEIAAAIQAIHDNQQAAVEYARLHGVPASAPAVGGFFRVREESGVDSDGDGLTDEQELALGLNILAADTDGDGMPDAWEVANGLDARDNADDWLDPDGDGKSNAEESRDKTNPNSDDTDGDGVKDGLDAVPDVPAIDWSRTPESGYAWVPITGAPLNADALTKAQITNDPVVLFGPGITSGGFHTPKVLWDGTTVRTLEGGLPAEAGDGGWVFGYRSPPPEALPPYPDDPQVVCWIPGSTTAMTVATGGLRADDDFELLMRASGAWGGGTEPRMIGPSGLLALAARSWDGTAMTDHGQGLWTPTLDGQGGCAWSFAPVASPDGFHRAVIAPDGTLVMHGAGNDTLRRPDGTTAGGPGGTGAYWITPTGRLAAVGEYSGNWRLQDGTGTWNAPEPVDGGPPALLGGQKMNRRGEVLDPWGGRLWRNGKWTPLADLLPPDLKAAGWQVTGGDLNDDGVLVAGLRASGAQGASDFSQVGLLAPVELDVNNNGQTADRADGLGGYLPGYEGSAAKLHVGADFEHTTYSGPQAMRLMLRGFGTGTVDAAEFKIVGVTNHKGFCGNGDEGPHFGEGKDDDFSFEAGGNQREIAGQVADGQVWAPLFCKDYGGWCEIEIVLKKAGQPLTPQPLRLRVPQDDNYDKIADTWQDAQIDAWNNQFKPQPAKEKNASVRASMTLNADGSYSDAEEADSDGPGPSPAMADAGDGLSVLDEYRGYILDGGPCLAAPDHRRLSAARKELLVQAIETEGIATQSANGEGSNWAALQTYSARNTLGLVSDFYRNNAKGGMIDLYWCVTSFNPSVQGNEIICLNNFVRPAYSITGKSVAEGSNVQPTPFVRGQFNVFDDRWLRREDGGDPQLAISLYGQNTGHPRKLLAHGRDDKNLGAFIKLGLFGRAAKVRNEADPGNNTFAGGPGPGLGIWSHTFEEAPSREVDARAAGEANEKGCYVFVSDLAEEHYKATLQEDHLNPAALYDHGEFNRTLAYAIAHELGHLLIVQPAGDEHGQRPACIMSASPVAKDLTSLVFGDGDGEETKRINLRCRESLLPQP